MVFLMKDKKWKDSDPRGFVTVAYEPNLRNLVERAMSEQDEVKMYCRAKWAGMERCCILY